MGNITDNSGDDIRPRALLPAVLHGRLARYSAAIVMVVFATTMRRLFLPALEMRVAFITFYPAVVAAALCGGLGPGLLATFLSAVAVEYFWFKPAGQTLLGHPID